MRISRFRLSEKGSRCRPRESARPFGKADEPSLYDASSILIGEISYSDSQSRQTSLLLEHGLAMTTTYTAIAREPDSCGE
jgi:hypothetical protein